MATIQEYLQNEVQSPVNSVIDMAKRAGIELNATLVLEPNIPKNISKAYSDVKKMQRKLEELGFEEIGGTFDVDFDERYIKVSMEISDSTRLILNRGFDGKNVGVRNSKFSGMILKIPKLYPEEDAVKIVGEKNTDIRSGFYYPVEHVYSFSERGGRELTEHLGQLKELYMKIYVDQWKK